MGFLNKLFGKKEIAVTDYKSFWDWFVQNEQSFFNAIKHHKNVEADFLDKVIPQLHKLNEQFYCLAGMDSTDVAELAISPEGDIKNIIFTEELVLAAPSLPNWKFTATKPPTDRPGISVNMHGYEFNHETLSFTYAIDELYPDEIEINIIHRDYTEDNKKQISQGVFIYLDNTLGEIDSLTIIDYVNVRGNNELTEELISISKLREYLQWREKEFVEKYKGTRYNTENDHYSVMEATDKDGYPVIAVVNQDLLEWDAKASHPWLLALDLEYDGTEHNGLPDKKSYELMEKLEDELMAKLKDNAGYLNLGRETSNNKRTIYWACKEFRDVSKMTNTQIQPYTKQLKINYEIFKDKYWRVMNPFRKTVD